MSMRKTRVRTWTAAMGLLMVGLLFCPSGRSWAVGQVEAPAAGDEVLAHLNHVLRWARQWENPEVMVPRSADAIYLENGRSLARQVVRLEFQSALAQAKLMGENPAQNVPAANNPSDTIDTRNLLAMQQRAQQQVQELQARLNTLNARIERARARDIPGLTGERDTVQGQMELAQALHDNLEKLTSFTNTTLKAGGAADGLTAKILALEHGAPGAPVQGSPGGIGETHTPAPSAQATASVRGAGLIGQMGELFHFVQSLRTLAQLREDATALRNSTRKLRAPLLAGLRTTLQQGQVALAAGEQEDAASTSSKPSAPAKGAATQESAAQKQQAMKALVRHFKLLSNATLPLSQEMVLLDQSQTNLNQLQISVKRNYGSVLRTLLLKVAGILIVLGAIWLVSELWRKAVFRYIREARRRRQFLVLRRVVTGFCMVVVILLGFVSDFSSLATYAGLITAGIAVALQAVILSVAAYFFLVGRYGVKVGDRVTVVYNGANSVAGDVVDIGLVRFYMTELAGSGIDMQPTGRICVFPNSVLFQTNPLFKQWPGTEYTWREIALPLGPESDGKLAEKELLAVVDGIYSTYHAALDRQHLSIEETMGVYVDTPKPYTQVRFVGLGLEVMVRYPIPLRQAVEYDDRMVMEVRDMLRRNPSIQLASGSAPELRAPVKG